MESLRRSSLFIESVDKYCNSDVEAPETSHDYVVRGKGGDLYFYCSGSVEADNRPIVFCIPSLINKHYILDLHPEYSLIRQFCNYGFDAILLQWPEPSQCDSGKIAADYVCDVLNLLQQNSEYINRPVILVGYCIGGVLAIALAQLFKDVAGLVLLATPWNYSGYPLAKLSDVQYESLHILIESEPLFSATKMQILLYMANSYRIYQRYAKFANMNDADNIRRFVLTEHWANDGVAITRAFAKEALLQWPVDNLFMNGKWVVNCEEIIASQINVPALLAIPKHDSIVPRDVAYPLTQQLPYCEVITPEAGHVGMIVGSRKDELYNAIGSWLYRHFCE